MFNITERKAPLEHNASAEQLLTFRRLLVQDCFFYSLVFDPVQKTLLADQGEIRVGSKYQAEIPDKLAEGERGAEIRAA